MRVRVNKAMDKVEARLGRDMLGTDSSDHLRGSRLNDTLSGGMGDDKLDGRGGDDTSSYADADSAVRVDLGLSGPQDTGGAGVDMLVRIENLIGSRFADHLTGDAGANRLVGGHGADVLTGGAGADRRHVDLRHPGGGRAGRRRGERR